MTLDDALRRDADDPFAAMRTRFALPDATIYFDGNSLGALPLETAAKVSDVVNAQWGRDLVGSWNGHDWIGLPRRLGAKIAPMIGAHADEILVCDTTSINIFKLVAAALGARPGRSTVLSEGGNFPTDLYMAQSAAAMSGNRILKIVDSSAIVAAIDDDTALLVLTHVHYKSGHRHDMAALTAAAHARGALVLWDLSHSCGAIPVDLAGCNADLAVGCGYKYLNGGPGAPAWLYVARRLQDDLQSPLPGWMGHAAPFAFDDAYRPAAGIDRFQCGTPSVLAMAALESGLDLFADIDRDALYAKGAALGDYFIDLMEARCAGHGFALASPSAASARGSHISFAHPDAYPICRALIVGGIVGDFRAPDILRMGFAPLYNSFADVWHAVAAIRTLMETGEWDRPANHVRAAVT